MPNITVPISDLLPTVERPVIYDVMRQIQDKTGISSKTQIRYYGEDAKAQQWNSAIDKNQEHNLWPVVSNLTIEVDEDYNMDQMLGIAVKQPDQPPIFFDDELGVLIRPIFTPQDVVIRFKYKTKDRNEAIRWRNEFRTRVAMNRQVFVHTIQFSYLLPTVYIDLLNQIWMMSQAIGGDGSDFNTWLRKRCTDKLTELANISGQSQVLAISMMQTDVQGVFDIDGVPEKPQKDGEMDNWVISASYNFRYSKPINTECFYPHLIHQQVIPKKYRFATTQKSLLQEWKTSTKSGQAFEYFQADSQYLMRQANLGIVIPEFEQFYPAFVPSTTLRVMTVMAGITPTDKRTLFNLGDLGDYAIHPDILDFIRNSEYPFMCNSFNSILGLHLYQNEDLVSDGILSVTSNLDVVATSDLDLTKRYHVRLCLCADMTYLTPSALARVKAYPAVLQRLVAAINAGLTNSGNHPDLRKNKLLPVDYVLLGLQEGSNLLIAHSLVQVFFIEAKRLSDYKPPVPDAPIAVKPIFSNISIS